MAWLTRIAGDEGAPAVSPSITAIPARIRSKGTPAALAAVLMICFEGLLSIDEEEAYPDVSDLVCRKYTFARREHHEASE